MEHILSIKNVAKSYGPIQALKGVSFDVPEGSVFGVLGPNGSGKTTLLGTLLGVLNADAGSYSWFGGSYHGREREHIGSLLETPNFYHYMSAWDNLAISAAIKGRGAGDRTRVLQQVGLLERQHSKFQSFSLGMKQRLAIGAALLGNPKVLVLDEPTNGLDPNGIAEIRQLVRDMSKAGITIIIASHLLDEVEKVCTHVAILKKGALLVHGPVDEVLRSEDQLEISATDMGALSNVLKGLPGIARIKEADGRLQLTCNAEISAVQVNEYCMRNGVVPDHLVLRKKSLETKFMELTNN